MAGYSRDNTLDATLLDYINNLQAADGDVILVMDNDLPADELKKLHGNKHILHTEATRHGEYDFGSYKRGYTWARDKKLLGKYDWIYLVNDSVYCLTSPCFVLDTLEHSGAEFTGIVTTVAHDKAPHFQSWFTGVSSRVARTKWFDAFMSGITHMPSKEDVVLRYEVGLSALMQRHGIKSAAFDALCGKQISMNQPLKLLHIGAPFIKRTAIPHVHKINRLLPYVDDVSVLKNISEYSCRMGWMPVPYMKSTKWRLKVFGITILTLTQNAAGTAYNYNLFGKIRIAQFKVLG